MIGFGLLVVQALCTSAGGNQASSHPEALIVTARKRPEQLLDVPESVTTISAATMAREDIRDVVGVASRAPNVAFAYGNAATGVADARTLSIRGISGPNTTAVYLDRTPLPGPVDPTSSTSFESQY